MIIRAMGGDDLPVVSAIEQQMEDGWTEGMLAGQLTAARGVCLLAEAAGEVLGYILCRYAAGEAEVLRLGVVAAFRRRGIGGRLLTAALQCLLRHGVTACFLEVRRSNTAARGLYGGYGFVDVGTRRHYYRAPVEDGLILRRSLSDQPETGTGSAAGHPGPAAACTRMRLSARCGHGQLPHG